MLRIERYLRTGNKRHATLLTSPVFKHWVFSQHILNNAILILFTQETTVHATVMATSGWDPCITARGRENIMEQYLEHDNGFSAIRLNIGQEPDEERRPEPLHQTTKIKNKATKL